MELFEYKGIMPQISKDAYVQEGVKICGDVKVGAGSTIWYNSTLRGDTASITIGENTSIQELSTVHVDTDYPVEIGSNVTIGHNCIIHGATIADNVLVGMGAILLNGCKIPKNCMIGAGALVTQNSVFEEGMLILGSPAKAIRPLKEADYDYIIENAKEYVELGKEHKNVK